MLTFNGRTIAFVVLVAIATNGQALFAQDLTQRSAAEVNPPFGGPASVAYAAELWDVLTRHRLIGENSYTSFPYAGNSPHGQALEYFEARISVDGHSGVVMVKKNYDADLEFDALTTAILNDRQKHLASITVMFRRESGYDSENGNWFWAKYLPDGSLDKNPKDMRLAGRVAKGGNGGCIACHLAAPAQDYVFTHDKFAN